MYNGGVIPFPVRGHISVKGFAGIFDDGRYVGVAGIGFLMKTKSQNPVRI